MENEELSFTRFSFGDQHVHDTTCSFLTAIKRENHKPYGQSKPYSLNNKGSIQLYLVGNSNSNNSQRNHKQKDARKQIIIHVYAKKKKTRALFTGGLGKNL